MTPQENNGWCSANKMNVAHNTTLIKLSFPSSFYGIWLRQVMDENSDMDTSRSITHCEVTIKETKKQILAL